MIIVVLFSVPYPVFRVLLTLGVIRGRREPAKDIELLVLGHEVAVLRQQLTRPGAEPKERFVLAALSRMLARELLRVRMVARAAAGSETRGATSHKRLRGRPRSERHPRWPGRTGKRCRCVWVASAP